MKQRCIKVVLLYVVFFLLLIYLFYALIHPEEF
ncbi:MULTISPECIES: K(+)-transporting ATPase subunit F [Caldanaerobacter]|uniref:K(+)-transporting ATPase subunit F n=1 Tax=Caldanaerobacter subterraneus subsp. pacificus DSM 12653 TaxID=391606 RepID=A0A0F5PK46_9THEO|nr:hypothetical protein CDSM653_01874 [Caldanaerobacter subterraneus subsp. pacificus DSM 12653]